MTSDEMTTAHARIDGFLRLRDVLRIIPVSRSTWYEGIKAGRFPRQVRIIGDLVAWRVSDIRALVDRINAENEERRKQ